MDEAIIIDTDIASAFAKIGRLDLLKDLFSKHPVFITPRIFEEISVPWIWIQKSQKPQPITS